MQLPFIFRFLHNSHNHIKPRCSVILWNTCCRNSLYPLLLLLSIFGYKKDVNLIRNYRLDFSISYVVLSIQNQLKTAYLLLLPVSIPFASIYSIAKTSAITNIIPKVFFFNALTPFNIHTIRGRRFRPHNQWLPLEGKLPLGDFCQKAKSLMTDEVLISFSIASLLSCSVKNCAVTLCSNDIFFALSERAIDVIKFF